MSIFEIILLVIVFVVGASIISSTIKVGISPMPSSKKAYDAMLSLIDETGSGDIYDLGSGWGNLVIRLARKYPERQVVGYELSFFPWLFAKAMKSILSLNNLALYREDFMTSDLTEASVITCYLFPKTMQKVEAKLQCQINDGTGKLNFVVSNNFALPSYQATKTIRLNDFYKSPVYLYRMQ